MTIDQVQLVAPASLPVHTGEEPPVVALQLQDGSVYQGSGFGANLSVAGEIVFQTGQILVLTAPLIGNYGVPPEELDELNKLPLYFESAKIHIAALVVGRISEDYSHFLAKSSLSQWMKDQGIPGISGIDTRALTKKIRTKGALLGKLLVPNMEKTLSFANLDELKSEEFMALMKDVSYDDPNERNLVEEVSTRKVLEFQADKKKAVVKKDGKVVNILAVDVGMKYNQIRCFTSRGVNLKVVPWDFDFNAPEVLKTYDGLFISNGPGDPTMCKPVVERLRMRLEKADKPVFGICLGHQLLALASGAKTKKMKFGNRGHNIPCTDMLSGKCYITSQNHGYAVEADSLQQGWIELFVNANDGSNEGIAHTHLPFFSVQFHPESTPGPRDTEFLFDKFIKMVVDFSNGLKPEPIVKLEEVKPVGYNKIQVRKVLILGSGGLSIGQAGEFDYSGSQAIKALKEEGIYTVLMNPNIATIQTSKGLADKVYFLPVSPEFVRKVIEFERPDGIYVSFGGQTALNCGVKMIDEFEKLGVRVLGTPLRTVMITEDRELFAQSMAEIDEKCAQSASATNVKEAMTAAKEIGFPLIVRAAYALGGLGSGFASSEKELLDLCNKAFAVSPQVLIEKSMKGWKEIEYEVVRDAYDNCITVCNMENFDPLGIHTGDSIVVAPSQTLSDEDYHMLRSTAVKVIRHLGVVGECNIQYALNPVSKQYCIIEVNARLSRSSALASKATGYPLAFVAAKLGLGMSLNELKNGVTKVTCACFEPSLDYVVVKIPRWDLKKFHRVSTKVGSAMKSVGEVMAIGRNFEETIQKAIRSVDYQFVGLSKNDFVQDLEEELMNPSDQRIFAIINAFHKGYTIDRVWELTRIDKWFLQKLMNIVQLDKIVTTFTPHTLPQGLLKQAKQLGFSDRHIAKLVGTSEMVLRKIRKDFGVYPFVKQIDTVAAEFPCFTNYLYMTYNASEHDIDFNENGIMVLGSGVYRIGSSVEFDWCAVRTVRTLRKDGFKTIMVNYNPETVSTDYDEADRLYFEDITLEKVLDIYELEASNGVVVSVGGQTPNNIALALHRQNVKIIGTSPEQIDGAENRYKFSRMLDKIGVDQPRWKELTSLDEARKFCDQVGFPVLVRPSYVLSGAAMNVVYSPEDLDNFLLKAVAVSSDYPVVITKFIEEAKEIEMDAVAKDGVLVYHVISEHVENAGVHSGDATLVLPPQDLERETVRKIEVATAKIANSLNVTGPMNIQFIAKNNEIKVIECNLRASRSFPFVSKVMGVDMIELATRAMMGLKYEVEIPEIPDYVAIKVPQFSFSRLSGADPVLGVEMASTGEVACFGKDKFEAYLKALKSTGMSFPKKNILLSIGSYKEKQEFLPSVWKLNRLGFDIFATSGTCDFYQEHGIPVKLLDVFHDNENSLMQHLENNLIDLYINLPSRNRYRRPANYVSKGYETRRKAVDLSIPLITNVKCAKLFVESLSKRSELGVSSLDCQTGHRVVHLPGFVDLAARLPEVAAPENVLEMTRASVSSGFTTAIVTSTQPLNEWRELLVKNSLCDFVPSVPVEQVEDVSLDLLAQFNLPVFLKKVLSMDALMTLVKHVPQKTLILTDYSGSELASLLFISNLLHKRVHVNLIAEEDLKVVQLSKTQGIQVTCGLRADALFGKSATFYLENVESIDCFHSSSKPEQTQTILMDLVYSNKLALEQVVTKCFVNPTKILNLPESPASVEVEMDRPQQLDGSVKFGCVSRVSYDSKIIYVDGFFPSGINGREIQMGVAPIPPPVVKSESPIRRSRRLTSTQLEVEEMRKREMSLDRSVSVVASNAFYKQNILSVKQFTRQELHILFQMAQEMRTLCDRKGGSDLMKGRILCNLFYEPSTRTQASFEAAMLRMGGQVIQINQNTSSVAKGESLADTVRTLGSYSDLVVLRHPEVGSVSEAAKFSNVPLINAGDGIGEHPTQALLDVFTIREELGSVNGLTITLIGDLKNGRTVHSLVKLLAMYDVRLNYVSPAGLKMPGAVMRDLNVPQQEFETLSDDLLARSDVLYVTRVQKERFEKIEDYEQVKNAYLINSATLRSAKSSMIVMHPLPRVGEIDPEVDVDQRAAYFRQMKYGLYVRMALIALVLNRV